MVQQSEQRTSPKKRYRWQKSTEKISTSLLRREMQIKVTIPLDAIRVALKKAASDNKKCW